MPPRNPPLKIVDIGCGTGRYSHIVAKRLEGHLRLYCCDYSSAMLEECRKLMLTEVCSNHVQYYRINANELPFSYNYFDAVITFNAVHHFDLNSFAAEATRILSRDGILAIYTRTPEQNEVTIWGEHFPEFAERETRLYSREYLEETIGDILELQLEYIQEFEYVRTESVESLLNRARNLHYSTFALYPQEELRDAIETFTEKLTAIGDSGMIDHTAKNTLILARRI